MNSNAIISIGLLLDIAGVVCLGYIVQRGWILTLQADRTIMVPNTKSAIWANHLGWPLIIIGFLLQIIGQWI